MPVTKPELGLRFNSASAPDKNIDSDQKLDCMKKIEKYQLFYTLSTHKYVQ